MKKTNLLLKRISSLLLITIITLVNISTCLASSIDLGLNKVPKVDIMVANMDNMQDVSSFEGDLLTEVKGGEMIQKILIM